MPIYEYECSKCGLILEKIQNYNDPPLIKCSKCETKSLTKKISSNTNFHLKGNGWYDSGGY